MKNNIILCGLPGVGKTSIGLALAKETGREFVDLDTLIESNFTDGSLSCREIFKKIGEQAFRTLEHNALKSFNQSSTVLSVGGGVMGNEENISLFKRIGKIIYLKNDPETIYKRLMMKGGIPPYLDPENPQGSFNMLVKKREPIYEMAADIIINTLQLNPSEVSQEVIKLEKFKIF